MGHLDCSAGFDAVPCDFSQPADAALTIATIPARTASGSVSHRSTNSTKSGDFRAKSAKQDAKTFSLSPEVLESSVVAESACWSSKPVGGLKKAVSGFDSHTLPLQLISRYTGGRRGGCLGVCPYPNEKSKIRD